MGAPNAGKSSLLNALAGRDVAIVTEEAGTTRDVTEVHLHLGAYPVTLVDTAGRRQTDGIVEREGIRRAEERGQRADLILWAVEPGGVEQDDPVQGLKDAIRQSVSVVTVRTKQDDNCFDCRLHDVEDVIHCSTKSAEGMEILLEFLTRFAEETISVGEAPLATRTRHRHFLNEAVASLKLAVDQSHLPVELRAEDLRRAADAIGRITGRIDVEDLLDVIFRDFCIGK